MIKDRHRLSILAADLENLSDIPIKDGQFIFIKDKGRIVLDLDGDRTFYNNIIIAETEADRLTYSPNAMCFVFVKETEALWLYEEGWVQLTSGKESTLVTDTGLPDTGEKGKLYVDLSQQCVSVWDATTTSFVTVGEASAPVPASDIINIFN